MDSKQVVEVRLLTHCKAAVCSMLVHGRYEVNCQVMFPAVKA
jgi:hypothetical protein